VPDLCLLRYHRTPMMAAINAATRTSIAAKPVSAASHEGTVVGM